MDPGAHAVGYAVFCPLVGKHVDPRSSVPLGESNIYQEPEAETLWLKITCFSL